MQPRHLQPLNLLHSEIHVTSSLIPDGTVPRSDMDLERLCRYLDIFWSSWPLESIFVHFCLEMHPLKINNVSKLLILTYSMVQSPSWAADWFAASQEIPRISRNPKVHYRTHKRQSSVPILGQPNPIHIPTTHLLEIHPNTIHPSTPRSPQWFLSLRSPQ